MNYYWISIINELVSTVAYAPKSTPISHELIATMDKSDTLPFTLNLHKVISYDNCIKVNDKSDIFYDYQPNSLAWPLMSEKMKNIICSHLKGEERIKWKEAIIIGNNENRHYYIPMFTSKLDVLNEQETVFVRASGIVLKPCFDKTKVEKYAIFHGPTRFWQITTQIYVNESIRKDLIQAGIKELSFSKVRIE